MKKGYGTRGTALEFMHTIPHSFYLPKIIVLCVNFKICQEELEEEEMSLIISWYILPQLPVAS